jgi:hypothetical protein
MVPIKPLTEYQRKPSCIVESVRQLMRNAIDWSNDEMALTRVDDKSFFRRYVVGLGLLLASFAILIAAAFTRAQTVMGSLAEYHHGHIAAGLLVSLTLFILTIGLMAAMQYSFYH